MITIGMPHFNDFDGVFFTLQSLKLYHDMSDVEILVIDNSGSDRLKKWMNYWTKCRYIRCTDIQGTAYAKNKVFEYATGDFVLCIDCHVLFKPESIDKLKAFVSLNSDSKDLYYGCLVYDDLKTYCPSMKNVWSGHMWGVWGQAYPEDKLQSEPVEIWSHGGGCFAAFKKHWLWFNSKFAGFGGEEGYLAEKYRYHGRKVYSLPWLKWVHRFNDGTGYRLSVKDKIRNYLIGFQELELDEKPLDDHFGKKSVDAERDKIVCCCPTYGRYDCLNETVESFIRQDYAGEKRLVILNDDPRVKYVYDHPNVKVLNAEKRCMSLGEKFTKLIKTAIETYPNALYMIWPQDDIMLPWALTEAKRKYEKSACVCSYPAGRWFSMKNKITKYEPTAISHLPLFSKEFFVSAGNFEKVSVGEDTNYFTRAKSITQNKCLSGSLGKGKAYHIYRWANGHYHISGHNKDEAWERCRIEVEKTMTPGEYKITPIWKADYVKMVEGF